MDKACAYIQKKVETRVPPDSLARIGNYFRRDPIYASGLDARKRKRMEETGRVESRGYGVPGNFLTRLDRYVAFVSREMRVRDFCLDYLCSLYSRHISRTFSFGFIENNKDILDFDIARLLMFV